MKLKTRLTVQVKNKKHSICIAVIKSFQFWFSLGSQQSPLLVTVKHSSSLIIRFNLGGSSLFAFLPFHQSSIFVRVFDFWSTWREPGMGVLVPLFFYVVAFFCTAAAIALAVLHIYRHLLNYTEPTYQRFIVRIIFMVPVSYSLFLFANHLINSFMWWFLLGFLLTVTIQSLLLIGLTVSIQTETFELLHWKSWGGNVNWGYQIVCCSFSSS